MQYKVSFANAFATGIFDGNTAAVVIVEDYPTAEEMLALAALFNFSETAFLKREEAAQYHIRWFTPEVEVPLCGHATLASAGVLFAGVEKDSGLIWFHSLSGKLSARLTGDGIELDFPLDPPTPYPAEEAVLKALGSRDHVATLFAPITHNLVIVLASPNAVMALRPDFEGLNAMRHLPYHGIAATAKDGEGYICRYFAPWEGINEDPVTGSAQTYLAPYWSSITGHDTLPGYQASTRGGRFTATLANGRLLLRGRTVTYLHGNVFVP
jgi:PhzF family phenazine biosynthesis protein